MKKSMKLLSALAIYQKFLLLAGIFQAKNVRRIGLEGGIK